MSTIKLTYGNDSTSTLTDKWDITGVARIVNDSSKGPSIECPWGNYEITYKMPKKIYLGTYNFKIEIDYYIYKWPTASTRWSSIFSIRTEGGICGFNTFSERSNIQFRNPNNPGSDRSEPKGTVLNRWYNIVFYRDGNNFSAYSNGSYVFNKSASVDYGYITKIIIGNTCNNINFFNGKLSNFKFYIYDNISDDSEILDIKANSDLNRTVFQNIDEDYKIMNDIIAFIF